MRRLSVKLPRWIALAVATTMATGAVAVSEVQDKKREGTGAAQRYYRLGQSEFSQGKTLDAIASLKRAIDLDPKLADAESYLGVIYLQQSDPQQAAKHLKRAVGINPYLTDAHNSLGVAYTGLKKYDRALEEFQTALKDKTYETPEKIYLNTGHLYLEQGKTDEAIKSCRQAVAINPKYVRGFYVLGMAYQQAGQADLAAQQFKKVVKLEPESSEANQARQQLEAKVKRSGS